MCLQPTSQRARDKKWMLKKEFMWSRLKLGIRAVTWRDAEKYSRMIFLDWHIGRVWEYTGVEIELFTD